MPFLIACLLGLAPCLCFAIEPMTDQGLLGRLPVGFSQLRVLTPEVLELTLVTTKNPDSARLDQWDFITQQGDTRLPGGQQFVVFADGTNVNVKAVGFKRRVVYAPLKHRDLRIGNYLYLQLAAPIADNQWIEVRNPDRKLWAPTKEFAIKSEPSRYSPAIHVNQVGYLPEGSKKAMVGYFLGSMGELAIAGPGAEAHAQGRSFELREVRSGKEVFEGRLTLRRDVGFPILAYQEVMEADFSAFKTPGEYQLLV